MRVGLQEGWKVTFQGIQGPNIGQAPISYEKEGVCLPHSVVETPYNYFDESIYQGVATYSRDVYVTAEWSDRRIFLVADGVAHRGTFMVDGEEVGVHKCGYTAFRCDVTDQCIKALASGEGKIHLSIQVDSRENLDQPPFGKVIDYMTYGGIYRGVWLDVRPNTSIQDVYNDGMFHVDGGYGVDVTVIARDYDDLLAKGRGLELTAVATDPSGSIVGTGAGVRTKDAPSINGCMDGANLYIYKFRIMIEDAELWYPENPTIYTLRVTMSDRESGDMLDSYTLKFALRTYEWREDGFYLNGERYQIRGLNRHQSYPYVGYAMPDTIERRDARILKEELGLNAVRCSHYPQSHAFLNACDELGLLVFIEIPGWQHIGSSEEWRKQCIANAKSMVEQYRHHPSICLWGVRINESMDDDELYVQTNDAAKHVVPNLATGGVRYIRQSHLLEDVYTYNDFLYDGVAKPCASKREVTSDMKKAYLVSEYNGHMYPTKAWDDEEHLKEHALRHAKVLNAIMGEHDIAGSFGWCAFDYNTHKDFGSGDRVCYHGVMDMYRNPKPAAYLYSSQSDARPVFHVISSMDIGEHPAGYLGEVLVLTNATSVKLYKNGKFIKEFYPDREQFPNLPHPPIIIDDFVGDILESEEGYSHAIAEKVKKLLLAIQKYGQNNLPIKAKLIAADLIAFHGFSVEKGAELYGKYVGGWGDEVTEYRFVAMRNGEVSETIIKAPVTDMHLVIDVDKTVLNLGKANGAGAGEWFGNTSANGARIAVVDVAAIRFRVVDQNGNTMRVMNDGVLLKAEGSIELIGPEISAIRGGMGGTFVRSVSAGAGKLTLSFHGKTEELNFDIR